MDMSRIYCCSTTVLNKAIHKLAFSSGHLQSSSRVYIGFSNHKNCLYLENNLF